MLRNQSRTYFNISYDDHIHAKSLGARFDWDKKIWYAPNEKVKESLIPFYKEYTPFQGFVGEDRTFGGNQLFIDLIPSKSFYKNVRSMIYGGDWSIVSQYICNRVDNKCECCGIDCKLPSYDSDLITLDELSGFKLEDVIEEIQKDLVGLTSTDEWPEWCIDFFYNGKDNLDRMKKTVDEWNTPKLEAHERWFYDEETKIQKLLRIIGLCRRCHLLTHHGFAGLKGVHKFAEKHLMKVNGWTEEQVSKHRTDQWSIWKERSKYHWKLDLSLITDSGLEVIPIKMNKKEEDDRKSKEEEDKKKQIEATARAEKLRLEAPERNENRKKKSRGEEREKSNHKS